ncbi:MAG: hypothetical protein AAFY45_26145 [Bacteroidota bacterium]
MYHKHRRAFTDILVAEQPDWFMKLDNILKGYVILAAASCIGFCLIIIHSLILTIGMDDTIAPEIASANLEMEAVSVTVELDTTTFEETIRNPDNFIIEPHEDSLWETTEDQQEFEQEIPAELVPEKEEVYNPLERFITKLDKAKENNEQVRIGYFGDSMIEGDLITQSLRKDLQEMFGGKGVGFVPISSKIPGFRKTIRHRIGEWKSYNYFTPGPKGMPLGISGELFLADNPQMSWVSYKATSAFPGTEIFELVKLYYGGGSAVPEGFDSYVIVDTDQRIDTFSLDGKTEISELVISSEPTKRVELKFHIPSNLPIFGLSVESESGIVVDNFPSRSNSGTNLVKIPADVLNKFDNYLDYDLIVLQFGLNVVSPKRKSFSSYEKGMKRVVEHFKTHMPNTDILLVSVCDKSTKINGVLQTDPSVPLIVDAQQRVAEEMGIGFLNLYEEMGGRNSMIKWVKARPSLARSDYAHPNHRGAVKVSNIVKDFLLRNYDTHMAQKKGPVKETFSMRK